TDGREDAIVLTRIDHVMICMPDLRQGIEAYTRIGFSVHPGGDHTSGGTHNAIAFFEDDYLELLSVRGGRQHETGATLMDFLARGGGLRYIALQSDDLAADVAAMRRRGVDVSEPSDGGRRTPAGQGLRRRFARLGPGHPLPIWVIQHVPPPAARRWRAGGPGPSRCSIGRAAWTPPRSGWPITGCRRRRAASVTPASRRCWFRRRTRAASTSACSGQRRTRFRGAPRLRRGAPN